jgi:hypothetical protein
MGRGWCRYASRFAPTSPIASRSLYFRRMTVQCQKCGKDYEPKRRGGKFCSVSCRVVQHQLVKKGQAWPNPPTANESYLAGIVVAVGRTASETLQQVEGLSVEAELAGLRALVQGWARVGNNSIIERIQYNEEQATKAFQSRINPIKASK